MTSHGNDVTVLRNLLLTLVHGYTFNHSDLTCETFTPTASMVIFQLQAEKTDHQKMVGRKGVNIHALQRIFRGIGRANGLHIEIKLIEPKLLFKDHAVADFDSGVDYDFTPIVELLSAVISLMTGDLPGVTAENIPGSTAFSVRTAKPIDAGDQEALRKIFELLGNHQRRQFYLEMRN